MVVLNMHAQTALKLKDHKLDKQEIELKQLKTCLKDLATTS